MRRPFGQHFLFDPGILKRIVDCADVSFTETVVEIGPGLGTLTGFIAERAKRVIAIEFDKKLIGRLSENLSDVSNVEIITADALSFPFHSIPDRFKVVSNIPYHITSPLLFRLLECRDRLISMTLLLQKEVAARIVSPAGSRVYGVLSVSVQFYTRPDLIFSISRKAFSPPPLVDSAVVHFAIPPDPLYRPRDKDLFFAVVKRAFSQRRKMLVNSLGGFHGVRESLDEAGISPKQRPEEICIEEFVRLADALYNHYNKK